MSEVVLAVDIGGTKILVGLVDAEGTIVRSEQVATPAREGAEAIIAAVSGLAKVVLAGAPSAVNRCGVGTAGVVGEHGEITSATQEQTAGIGQINQAVIQLDTVTQQNAALVEEAAAAADSLNHQAQQLVQAVAVFQLGPDAQRPTPAVPRAAAAEPQQRRAPALPRAAQKATTPRGDATWAQF